MMRFLPLFLFCVFAVAQAEESAEKFRVIEFVIELSEEANLCVYQANLQIDPNKFKILSVESGEKDYFSEAPIYEFNSKNNGLLSIGLFRKQYTKVTPKKFHLFRLHVLTKETDASSIQIKKMILADENGQSIKGLLSPKLLEEKE